MKLFSILTKQQSNKFAGQTQNFVVIADKFSWYAFLLTPVWAIHKKLLKAFFVWFTLVILLFVLASLFSFAAFWPLLLVGLWFGLEAPHFEAEKVQGDDFALTFLGLASNQLDAEILAVGASQEDAQK